MAADIPEGKEALVKEARWSTLFGEAVLAEKPDELVVERSHLAEVAKRLRDDPDLGYDYCTNVTSVDYPDYFEVVYHLLSISKGKGLLTLKTRTPKDDPVVPSLTPIWPAANFQEREVWDMMGVRFEGHPNLRRILLWEGFAGHPLRKDWREPYYEEDHKPFGSRWPDGVYTPAETRTPWGRNVQYPPGWDPDEWEPPDLELPTVSAAELSDVTALKTDRILVNVGPQHPSTHGVFRMKVTLEGETVVALEPVMGYLHRCHEKIGERNLYIQNIPFTDRLDYITAMANNLGYVTTVEKLLGIQPPPRAEFLRVIMAEFTRVMNHLLAIGFLFNDLGLYFTAALYGIRERELILDLFEMASGSRMMCNYMRFGGVAHDLPEEGVQLARDLAFDRLPRVVEEFERYLNEIEIFTARTVGVGVLPPEQAIALGASGPVLRGSGVKYDIRKFQPYSIYEEFEFDIPTGTRGDVYDRYMVRIQEIWQSLRILKQALDRLPGGEIQAGKKAWQVKVPAGEVYGRVENPKGELGFFIVSDGSPNPYRYHIRSPSFVNLTALEPMAVGQKIADLVVILGSIDITLGEVDR